MREEAGVSTEVLLEGLRGERRRTYSERYAGDMKKFAEEAFEVYQGEARRWRWRLFRPGGAGEVLAASPESYPDRAGADKALLGFKEHAENARLEPRPGEAGTFEWRLLAPERGDVIATGVPCASAEEARRAALGVRRIAAAATYSPSP